MPKYASMGKGMSKRHSKAETVLGECKHGLRKELFLNEERDEHSPK
jgi:hypothetical protein